MAMKQEDNPKKALSTNARSRTIIIFTALLVAIMVGIGFYKFFHANQSIDKKSGFSRAPSINSIPGAINQSARYAALQNKQNIDQAKSAQLTGKSAIPTVINSQQYGSGVHVCLKSS